MRKGNLSHYAKSKGSVFISGKLRQRAENMSPFEGCACAFEGSLTARFLGPFSHGTPQTYSKSLT